MFDLMIAFPHSHVYYSATRYNGSIPYLTRHALTVLFGTNRIVGMLRVQ